MTRRRVHPTAVVLALVVAFAAALAPFTTATAQSDPAFPALTGRVVDAAELLDAATESRLDALLAAHESASSDQVVVTTVPSLDGYAIADYANRLGRAWGIGTAENDNGVLLLVAPNEREVRIEVGYGLEGALTDALSSTIIRREILPAFRDGDYAGGIETGARSILAAIEGEYTAPTTRAPGGGGGARGLSSEGEAFVPLFFLAMIAVPQLLRRGGARRAANGAFPAGFAGLLGMMVSGSVLVGLGIALALFALIYFSGKGGGGGGGTRHRRRVPGVIVGGGGFGGGFGGGGGGGFGGGFGGGGGGFGGGGASGSW